MHRRSFLQRLLGAGTAVVVPPAVFATDRLPFDLSSEEAQALANVVAHVGGDSQKSQRKHIDRISARLHYEGYKPQPWNIVQGNGIYFIDDDKVRDWRTGKRLIFPPGPDLEFRSRWRTSFTRDGELRRSLL